MYTLLRQSTITITITEGFSQVTDHAADLADIDMILQDQDVRQRHHPGVQNRKDECYNVDFIDGCGEELDLMDDDDNDDNV